jgi:hypothetical protein
MIIKHIHGVNLIKTYVFHVINNQTWVENWILLPLMLLVMHPT